MRCGTTGLRPTFGRVARTGAMTLCWSLDKIGPVTRTVEDAALVLAAIDGANPGDPSSLDVPLSLELRRAPSWSSIRDMLRYGRVDAAHMLSPVPVAHFARSAMARRCSSL